LRPGFASAQPVVADENGSIGQTVHRKATPIRCFDLQATAQGRRDPADLMARSKVIGDAGAGRHLQAGAAVGQIAHHAADH
jgi:hypothetical protein